jgi:hypothetical protein
MRFFSLLWTAGLVVATSGSAAAQAHAAEQYYEFEDDLLDGRVLDSHTALLEVRRPVTRALLIRPRAHFVSELLESVERL